MRNVLITVTGTTPQVITETLWALCTRDHPFVPDTIHVVTTVEGRQCAERRLLVDGILARLSRDLGLKQVPNLHFHVVVNADDEALHDIRDARDNTDLANTIVAVVRELTGNPNIRLHASLAGGRKTMGFYLGYALSLFGRVQDSLSHVMVPPAFERCRDFFYVPPVSQTLRNSDGQWLSTDDAVIELAEIPFLRLRDRIEEPLLDAPRIDFGQIVKSIQTTLEIPSIAFFDDDCEVSIGALRFELRPQLYAMYRLLAEVCQNREYGAGPDGVGEQHFGWLTSDDFATRESRGTIRFLRITENLLKASSENYAYLAGVIHREGDPENPNKKRMSELFRPIVSHLRRALKAQIDDPLLRKSFQVEHRGRRPSRFGLLLEADRIRLSPP